MGLGYGQETVCPYRSTNFLFGYHLLEQFKVRGGPV